MRTSLAASLICLGLAAPIALAQELALLAPGDAVVTQFSGVVDPITEPPEGQDVLDETFIDPQGVSVRVTSLAAPSFIWDARVWPAQPFKDVTAAEVGQVFGVTLDDAKEPNIYVAATSVYGLQIVIPDGDKDGRLERVKQGGPFAQWMAAQWGTTDAKDPKGEVGGPGSIWKIDGKSGDVSLFANIKLKGADNPGAGLGNIHFDKAHQQIFVSDLATGMIHRFEMKGQELEVYDPGFKGLQMANEQGTAHDPANALDITEKNFDAEDTDTWGYADEERSVWALTTHKDRLFYAMTGRNQIWSIGIDKKTGALLKDAQWELDYPKKPKELPVTDMLFTSQGAMVLAQRGEITSTYDYSNFANPGKSRLYRYWLESPKDDPATPSRWIAEPEEYAVGFEPDHRSGDGGIALGHGYTKEGFIDTNVCEASLWTTGDNLRRNEELQSKLLPGGPLEIDGLQGMPTGPVKQYQDGKNNTPPWVSYMVDVKAENTDSPDTDDPLQWNDNTTQGWMGDVAILRGCGAGGIADAGSYGWPTEWPWWVDVVNPPPFCIIGVDCPPPPQPKSCARLKGEFVCDDKLGEWFYAFDLSPKAGGFNPDQIKYSNLAPGHSILGLGSNPSTYSNPGTYSIGPAAPGQVVGADLCLFNEAEMKSGKPFACCKVSFDEQAPTKACKKAQ